MQAPVSVLMSVYGKEQPEYLRQALQSIYEQTLLPEELVLIHDGKLPRGLEEVITEYRENHAIQMVEYEFADNVQLGRALAKGVEIASQPYIARMDSDDIAMPQRIQMQLDYLTKHPEVTVLGGSIEEFYDDGSNVQRKTMPCEPEAVRQYGRYRNPVNHMTVMFRRDVIIKAGNYQHFPQLEDYHLWSRVLAAGYQVANLSDVLVRARTNESFYQRRGGWAYTRRYLGLRRMQRQWKLLGPLEYIQSIILTVGMAASPTGLRKMLYRTILRREK